MSKVYQWLATAYIVLLPCLFWHGLLQDQALAVAYPIATVILASLALGQGVNVRFRFSSLAVAAVCSTLFNMPKAGFPALVLHLGLGILACIGLLAAPSAWWLTDRLVWLALLNAAFALAQRVGYSPILETDTVTGLFSTRSQLGILLMLAVPLTQSGAIRALLALTAAVCGSVTAMLGISLWWLSRRLTRIGMLAVLSLAAATLVYLQVFVPGWDVGRIQPRLLLYREVFSESLWSPLWGYGLGTWEAGHSANLDALGPWFYNAYLAAWHAGGLLCLAPILWIIHRVFVSKPSAVRDSLLLLAFACLIQTPFHHLRLVIVTLTLLSAWQLKESA